jgi:hypothetical protein
VHTSKLIVPTNGSNENVEREYYVRPRWIIKYSVEKMTSKMANYERLTSFFTRPPYRLAIECPVHSCGNVIGICIRCKTGKPRRSQEDVVICEGLILRDDYGDNALPSIYGPLVSKPFFFWVQMPTWVGHSYLHAARCFVPGVPLREQELAISVFRRSLVPEACTLGRLFE